MKTYLGSKQSQQQGSGDDLADITTETIYERSTDEILDLNAPFNIDDTGVEFLYDGSITQNGGDDRWSGLYLVGNLVTGTEPMIVQDNKVLPSYWGTGINGDDERIMKIMVRTKKNGAIINGGKIRTLAREYNDTYQDKFAEFDVTLGLANATAALFTEDDINCTTALATVEGWTSIVNTEGWQELDIDGSGASGQEFYSKWDIGTQTINDTYERGKWIAKRATIADENNAETGDDWVVDNATITGIGTEFTARDNAQKLVEARLWLKIGAGTPTGNMYCELFLSDGASPAEPTGAVLATSEVFDTNRLTSSYVETIFRFNDNVTLTADEDYFIVIQHPDGDASNYVHADGDTTSADDGNYAYYQAAAWTGVTGDALRFEIKSSPVIHSMAGELFRGITHEIYYDNGSGTFTEDQVVVWGTDVDFDTQTGSFANTKRVIFEDSGTWVNSGKIVYTNDSTTMRVILEDISGSTLADGYDIKDADDPTTNYAVIDTTITNQDKGGGEGHLLAHDDNTGTGEIYIQLLSGVAPVDNLPMRDESGATALVASTVNTQTIKPEFMGQSTGTNIIGAYGIGFDPNDVGSSDSFTDLGGTTRTPPNNVTFTVAGLVANEDYILVAPRTGAAMNKGLYTLNGVHNSPTQTSITVNEAIQTETPASSSGTDSAIRVEMDTGIYRYQEYTSWTGSVFTIASTDYSGGNAAASGNDTFPSYIDVLTTATTKAFTAVHATTRDILIRVRDGGDTGGTPIKTVSQPAQFTGSPQTVTINRVDDY
jgi:hypothetical protein